jgi:hypothetical protein
MTQEGPSLDGGEKSIGTATGDKSYRLTIFIFNIIVIGALFFLACLYEFKYTSIVGDKSLYLISAWFGALGGVMISLKGIYDHASGEWDSSFALWHFGRPVSGAVAGFMTVILLTAVVPTPAGAQKPLAIYAAAFILGTQERRFFNLLSEVARLVVQVPDETKAAGLKIMDITPGEGPAATLVIIKGQGIEPGASIKLGNAVLDKPVIAPDGTSAAGIVPSLGESTAGAVDITVTNLNGTSFVLPKKFKYAGEAAPPKSPNPPEKEAH